MLPLFDLAQLGVFRTHLDFEVASDCAFIQSTSGRGVSNMWPVGKTSPIKSSLIDDLSDFEKVLHLRSNTWKMLSVYTARVNSIFLDWIYSVSFMS